MIWKNILLMNLMLPFIMLLLGVLFLKQSSGGGQLHHFYRGQSAQKREKCRRLHQYMGIVCCIWGSMMTVFASGMMLLVLERSERDIRTMGSLIGIAEGIMMVCGYIFAEHVMRKKFGF